MYYPTAYNNVFGGYQPQVPQIGNKIEIPKVHGRAGAEMYQLPVNSSILLLDDTDPIVWLKITDAAGYTATLSAYDINLHQDKQTSSLEKRIERLEGIINESYLKTDHNPTDATATQTDETKTSNTPKRK